MKMMLLLALLVGVGTSAFGEEMVYKTALFGSDYNSGNSSYTASFDATNNGFVVTATSFNNNNNGWTNTTGLGQIKCGRKNYASVGTITTKAAIDKAITKVAVTVDAFTSGKVNSFKLYVASDAEFTTNVQTITATIATGVNTFAITTPTANSFYKVEIDCASGSSNGLVTVSKVEYYIDYTSTLESIALSGDYPTVFHQGDTFSHNGMTVTATYEDEQTADVTEDATFSGYDMSTTGTQTVTVSYTENEVTKTATYSIEVKAPATLTGITLSGDYATEFATGSTFSYEGLTVTANYDDETTKEVTDYTVSAPDLTSAGAKTVTVTYTENGVTKTANYNVTVFVRQTNDFVKVTDASTLRVGDQLILVYEGGSKAMGGITGTNKYHNPVNVSINSNTITDPENVAILTLGGEEGAWTLQSSLSNNYLHLGGYDNELDESETVTRDSEKWTINISNGVAKIINKYYPTSSASVNTDRYIQYNSGSPRFACYASPQKNIAIYRLSQSVSITSACYATYYGSKALNLDALGITAYTAKVNGENVQLTEIDKVPANTPVILYKEGLTETTTFNVPVVATAEAVGNNDLLVSDGTTAVGDDIYVLANKNDKVGFYRWIGESSLSAGKIYLQIASDGNAREFFGFGDATAIETIKVKTSNSDRYYNLNGQRVAQPTKGLYIVNGKKIIIK